MKNLSLGDVQCHIQDYLLKKSQHALTLTTDTPEFSRDERLDVYLQAYRLRLVDALRNDYPALAAQMGDDDFREACEAFLQQHPSRHPSLRWLGEKLPGFLRLHATWGQSADTVELAEFEWAQAMAFDAADVPSLPLEALSSLAPEQWLALRLRFHPSLQQVRCTSNAPQVWHARIHDNAELAPEKLPEAQDCLVWREALQIVYRQLPAPEAGALRAFIDEQTFAGVCELLCNHFEPEAVPPHAARYLQQWLQDGLVIALATE